MSFFTSCRLHPFFLPLGRLASIPCQRFLEDLAQLLNHLSNAINVLQVSNINSTYSTHRIMYGIFTYIYYKDQPNVGKYTTHGSYWVHDDSISITWFSKTWSHRLPNTRSAPSLPMQFHDKLMFILLTFNASAWAWGRTRMANHFKPENLQRHVRHQTFEAKRSRVEVNVNESLTCLDVCRWSSSWSVFSILEWTSECVLPTTMSRCAEKLFWREKSGSIPEFAQFLKLNVKLSWRLIWENTGTVLVDHGQTN